MTLSLEAIMMSPKGFGLTTATNVQRAIWRSMTGVPLGDLWDDPEVQSIFRGEHPPECAPEEYLVIAGIRGAKSMTAAALAWRATQICNLDGVKAGEIPRYSIIAPEKDLATVCFHHLLGNVQESELLSQSLVGEPTRDSIMFQHPSGRLVEVKVVAQSRGGRALAARWSAGVCFDEAAKMTAGRDEAESGKSMQANRQAALGRLRPGAQIVYITSAFLAEGQVWKWMRERWGKPTRKFVVVVAKGRQMNPGFWTAERREEQRTSDDEKIRRAYLMDEECEFLDPETNAFGDELDLVIRSSERDVPPVESQDYVAAIDPATRGNAWTLSVGTCEGVGGQGGAERLESIVLVREWTGTKAVPLKPGAILAEMAVLLAPYRVTGVYTDQWSLDALRDLAVQVGLDLYEDDLSPNDYGKIMVGLVTKVKQKSLSLPANPNFRRDLVSIKLRTTATGVKVVLPETDDGRHCDFAPSLLRVLAHPAGLPRQPRAREDMWEAIKRHDRERREDPWSELGSKLFVN